MASAGDVNGDGFADMVIGAPVASGASGQVYIYFGGAAGLGAIPSPATRLTGPDGFILTFGSTVAGAGDVNGDGYADVIVGSYGASQYAGRAHPFLGGAAGLGSSPVWSITGPDGADGQLGVSVAGAGDVNGAGDADIIIGARGVANFNGRAYVYLGGPSGLSSLPVVTLSPAPRRNDLF